LQADEGSEKISYGSFVNLCMKVSLSLSIYLPQHLERDRYTYIACSE